MSEAELWIELLRAVGRFEFVLATQLRALFFGAQNYTTMLRVLHRMLRHNLIWRRDDIPLRPGRDTPPLHPRTPRRGRRPYIYGLTEHGRDCLLALGDAELDERHFRLIKARNPDVNPPSPLLTPHDVGVAWWLVGLVREAAAHPWVISIFVQVEFTVTQNPGGQRLDAYVELRLNPEQPRIIDGRIPWYDSAALHVGERVVRLALEWDRGTEAFEVIADKALRYRTLTEVGIYQRLFGGPVLPVLIAPTHLRAAELVQAWNAPHAWPGGIGVVAISTRAAEATDGPLWADYRLLADPARVLPLLTTVRMAGTPTAPVYDSITDRARWLAARPNPVADQ